jgi:bla regulator protein BlaR1
MHRSLKIVLLSLSVIFAIGLAAHAQSSRLQFEGYLESTAACAAVMGSNLRNRVKAMLKNRSIANLGLTKKRLATASAALMLPILVGVLNATQGRGQSENTTRLQFDVSSVKRNISGSQGTYFQANGGRFNAENWSVRILLRWSYRVQDFEIAEGPYGIDADHYDIEAKAGINANLQEMRSMVQGLLQDRFKLVLHHATKELPVYVLTVAKGGPKLKAGDCITLDPNTLPAPGQRQSAYCGFSSSGNNNIQGTSIPMTILADYLGLVLKRKVIDKTGSVGKFDVSLRWTPDGVSTGNPAVPATDNGGPSIFTALQEQVGLRLDSTKGPVEVLVIDHLEKPSEN